MTCLERGGVEIPRLTDKNRRGTIHSGRLKSPTIPHSDGPLFVHLLVYVLFAYCSGSVEEEHSDNIY
jgi:hypothetical protein